MKQLVLGSLIALAASQAAGCIISSSSTDEGHITASWTVKDVAPEVVVGCPPGVDTASLVSEASDSSGTLIDPSCTGVNTCFVDAFNCTDGVGTSAPLPAGAYVASIQLSGPGGLYATSVSALIDITNVDKDFHADIIDNGGYFHLSWQLEGAQTHAALTCADAGVTGGVETIATISGTQSAYNDKFDCADGDDYTAAVPAANYVVSVDAFDASNTALGPAVNINKAVGAQNDVAELGTVVLPIDGL